MAPDNISAAAGTAGSAQITATVAPQNATNKAVTYTQTDASVAGLAVDANGLVTWTDATPSGSYSFTVTTTDGNFTDTFILNLSEE